MAVGSYRHKMQNWEFESNRMSKRGAIVSGAVRCNGPKERCEQTANA